MKLTLNIPWPRFLAEGAIIVASILLAFAIDAWWESRGDKIETREMLEAVYEDFITSKADIAKRRDFNNARLDSVVELLKLAFDEEPNIESERMDELLSDMGWFNKDNEVATSNLDALIQSGQVANIANEPLRSNLGSWQTNLVWIRSQLRQDYEFYHEVWVPFARANTEYSQIHAASPGYPGYFVADAYAQLPVDPARKTDHRVIGALKVISGGKK